MARGWVTVLLIIVCGLILSACGGQAGESVELIDTQWTLTSLDGDPPIQGTEITLFFEADRIGGSAGCNQYGGQYELEGDEFTIGLLESTLILCEDPEGVMDQEALYLGILRQATQVSILSGDEGELPVLEIVSETGAVLTYAALPE